VAAKLCILFLNVFWGGCMTATSPPGIKIMQKWMATALTIKKTN
jgi:hypothetical protein